MPEAKKIFKLGMLDGSLKLYGAHDNDDDVWSRRKVKYPVALEGQQWYKLDSWVLTNQSNSM